MANNPLSGTPPECEQQAKRFNRDCHCITFSREKFRTELLRQQNGADLFRMLVEERPHLFADSPVFVPEACVRHQANIIAAIERTVALPAYRERVLSHAPPAARFAPKALGVFLGYDFHLGHGGPRLIEINTNAGGALLNAVFERAQLACCDLTTGMSSGEISTPARDRVGSGATEEALLTMFLEEWRLERGEAPLRFVAIVDENPQNQFLFPEFLLFRNLFGRNGIDAAVCDPKELTFRQGALWHGARRVDLVYNRLTDFGLQEETSSGLRDAYLSGAVVLTPHPHAHALYADKRNLVILTDEPTLDELGVDAATKVLLLEGIAHTEAVRPEEAGKLWADRKRLFFKPAAGYGGKAAYRGDKMTRRVFEDILRGDYVAQSLVPPSERYLKLGGEPVGLKLDIRNYVYRGRVQSLTTRLYQGQTTNFRTPGGGFAPVVTIPCIENQPSLEISASPGNRRCVIPAS